MKNKLIFRILGALASALISVSVFVPFMSSTGDSVSLWETYESLNSLYLPIMIIVFGAIGVIFFSLNIKTEFAYTSVGAIAFFVIMQTIDIIDQGDFKSLSIGYYFLIIGAFFTGLMAFLNNLKTKQKVEIMEEIKKEDASLLDQIDKLYNEQPTNQSEIIPIQPVDNIIQPLPIQPIEQQPIVEEQVQNVQVVQEQPIEEIVETEILTNLVHQENSVENIQVLEEPLVVQSFEQEPVSQPSNPVLQEFNVPMVEENHVEPTYVVEQQPIIPTPTVQPVNPVLQQFGMMSTPVVEEQPALNQEVINQPVNPTVQDFNNSSSATISQQSANEFDIFGQPINKS